MTRRKAKRTPRRRSGGKKPNRLSVALVVIVCLGLAMFSYPFVANWWNGRHMTDASATYEHVVTTASSSRTSADELKQERKAARSYNEQLLTLGDRFHLSSSQMREYLKLLDPTGTGVMGQIAIPKLGLDLPIYHTTDHEVLAEGIGHIPGSSLPVGGASTHCVISGHRGLPNSELFTNIDQLVEGDTFQLRVLGKTLTYQVDQIRIVWPDEVQDLAIEPGEDLCTLVTCTPYGINTQRLLVRGHRVPTPAAANLLADATQVDNQVVAAISTVVILALAWALYLAHERRVHLREGALARTRERLGLAG